MQELKHQLQEETVIYETHDKIVDSIENRSTLVSPDASSGGKTFMAVVCHLNKLTSGLKKFGGNPLEYQSFMRQFKTKVLMNCNDVDAVHNQRTKYNCS